MRGKPHPVRIGLLTEASVTDGTHERRLAAFNTLRSPRRMGLLCARGILKKKGLKNLGRRATKRIINKRGLVPVDIKITVCKCSVQSRAIARNLFTMRSHGLQYRGKYRSRLRAIQLGVVLMQLKPHLDTVLNAT